MMKIILALLTVATVALACNDDSMHVSIKADAPVQLDSLPGQCPYFTRDNKGNTAISWVRMYADSTFVFCYAISSDGKNFGDPVTVPGSSNIQPHGENLPKIVFKPSGEIIALWGAANPNPKNKYSGLVFYAQSFDEGKTWTVPKPLVTDTASYDQRYYDIALLPGGEAGIIWLDNRKTTAHEGSGLYYAATQGKNGFENGRLISQPCCQCCRTDLFADRQGRIHVLFRGIIEDSIRDMVHIVSTDDGKTFSAPQLISKDNWVVKGCPHTGPAMTENSNGLHFAWFTGGQKHGSFYTRSADNGKTFMTPDSISSTGSHPQVAALTNGLLVIAWDEGSVWNNVPYKRIGVQIRDITGKSGGKTFITGERSFASYPVLSPLDDSTSLVAYTKREGNKPYIAYQRVKVQ